MTECFNHRENIKISTVHYIQLYLLHYIYFYDETATENRTRDNSFTWQWFFRKLAYFLPEDSICVTQYVGETHLMYVLIRNCVFDWYI